MISIEQDLSATFGADRVVAGAALAPLTTFKVGGAADWLVTLRTGDEIAAAVRIARDHGVPLTCIGGGSNLLVADEGVSGLVVRVHGGDVRTLNESTVRVHLFRAVRRLRHLLTGRAAERPSSSGRSHRAHR